MPDLRLTGARMAALWAAPAGLAVGAAAWMLLGSGSHAQERLQDDQIRVQATQLAVLRSSPASDLAAQATAHPLFALTTGPGAVADILVRLDGIARSSSRAAALIAINGGEADWLDRGKSRGGVTLEDVQPSKVVLETALGRREVELGDPAPAPQQGAAMAPGSGVPPGVRLPPPPASAPGTP